MLLWTNAVCSYAAICLPEPCRNACLHPRTHLCNLAHPVCPDSPGNRGSGKNRPCFHRTHGCHILCHWHIHQHLQERMLTSDRPCDNWRQTFLKHAGKQLGQTDAATPLYILVRKTQRTRSARRRNCFGVYFPKNSLSDRSFGQLFPIYIIKPANFGMMLHTTEQVVA